MEQFFLHLLWNIFTVKLFNYLWYNSRHCTQSFCSLFSLFYNQKQCGRDSTGERCGQIDIGLHEWFNTKLDDPALNHSMLISAWNAETPLPPALRSYISRTYSLYKGWVLSLIASLFIRSWLYIGNAEALTTHPHYWWGWKQVHFFTAQNVSKIQATASPM